MGAIWEAFDQVLRRPVALKVMTPEHVSSDPARRRFEREATAIARLRNEHIIQIHDYGIDEDCPYIVMELLEGEDLEARLTRERQLSPSATLALLRQIAIGLQGGELAGIIHRDLKPANIFLARKEPGECVKLLDFGVVWTVFESDEEQQGSYRQGRRYAVVHKPRAGARRRAGSPERSLVARRHRLQGPHRAGSRSRRAGSGELLISICTDSFPPPSASCPACCPASIGFFEHALAKDPAAAVPVRGRFRWRRSRRSIEAQPRRPAKILIADDEPDVALMMKLLFRQKIREPGLRVSSSPDNGENALERAPAPPRHRRRRSPISTCP